MFDEQMFSVTTRHGHLLRKASAIRTVQSSCGACAELAVRRMRLFLCEDKCANDASVMLLQHGSRCTSSSPHA